MIKPVVTNGKVLLAEPFLLDPNFRRAAILLCEHEQEEDGGSLGFIMNKPLQTYVHEIVPDFPEFDAEVFFGGPVQTDTIHFVHSFGDLLDDSVELIKGIYWGGDFEKLKFLITSELVKPSQIRFFVGYSGWSKGQLNQEMKLGTWVMADMHPNYLFKEKAAELWQQIMYNKGETFTIIANMADEFKAN